MTGREPKQPQRIEPDSERLKAARRGVAAVAVALAAGSVVYRLVHWGHVDQTALLFIGIPTAMAIIVAYMKPAQSLMGTLMKATLIGVALSGIVFAEGLVCILMSAPLFLGVAAAVGGIITAARRGPGDARRRTAMAVLPFVLLSLEGTTDVTSLPREGSATAERIVAATPAEVRAKLAGAPYYYADLPLLFRSGFPTPIGGEGTGLEVGDERYVRFTMGSMRVRVTHSEPNAVTFARIEDTTPVRNWLEVGDSVITWTGIAPGRTRIRWTMYYERHLDPAWYFGPLERFGVNKAAGYLIDSVATP